MRNTTFELLLVRSGWRETFRSMTKTETIVRFEKGLETQTVYYNEVDKTAKVEFAK